MEVPVPNEAKTFAPDVSVVVPIERFPRMVVLACMTAVVVTFKLLTFAAPLSVALVPVYVEAWMFPVLVVFPKALKENVAAWLMVGAPSERIKVVEEPLTIEVPIEVEGFAAVGMVPVAHVGHAITFEPDHVIGDVALIEPFESPPPDGAAATHDEPFEVRTHVEVAAVAIGRYDVFVKAFVPSAVVVAVPPFAVPRTVPA